MFYRTDFGGFLVCCQIGHPHLNGVENNSVAISLMLSLENAQIDWTKLQSSKKALKLESKYPITHSDCPESTTYSQATQFQKCLPLPSNDKFTRLRHVTNCHIPLIHIDYIPFGSQSLVWRERHSRFFRNFEYFSANENV